MRVCINELTGHVCKNQETVYQKVFVVSEKICVREKNVTFGLPARTYRSTDMINERRMNSKNQTILTWKRMKYLEERVDGYFRRISCHDETVFV